MPGPVADRTRDLLRAAGLDAVILTSPASVAWATGHRCWLDPVMRRFMLAPGGSDELAMPALAIVPEQGRAICIANAYTGADDVACAHADVIFYNPTSFDFPLPTAAGAGTRAGRLAGTLRRSRALGTPADAVRAALQERGLTGSRLGLEKALPSRGLYDELTSALPGASLPDCIQLVRLARMVKTDAEIAVLERAAQISEQAGGEVLAGIGPATTAADVIDAFVSLIGAAGAQFDHLMYSVGGLGFGTSRRPAPVGRVGEVLAFDWGVQVDGYGSDTGQSVACGDIPDAMAGRHDLLARCIELGAQQIRPGRPASAPHVQMKAFLAENGISASFPHGHGLGLDVRDLPIIASAGAPRISDECVDVDADIAFEAGMVVNLEATILVPGHGAVEVERSFVVTEAGCRPLIRQDRAAPWQARGFGPDRPDWPDQSGQSGQLMLPLSGD